MIEEFIIYLRFSMKNSKNMYSTKSSNRQRKLYVIKRVAKPDRHEQTYKEAMDQLGRRVRATLAASSSSSIDVREKKEI